MSEESQLNTLIFDLDGTLIDTSRFIFPVYRKCFKRLNDTWNTNFTEDDILFVVKQIGTSNSEFSENLALEFGRKNADILLDCVEQEFIKQVGMEEGALFPNTVQVLRQLRGEKWNMAICTNAPTHYLEKIRTMYNLNDYFDEFYWIGLYPDKSKGWMIQQILKSFKTRQAVVIGDHRHDIIAAKENNLVSIGCLYGFAPDEAKLADYTITDILQLPDILKKLKKRN